MQGAQAEAAAEPEVDSEGFLLWAPEDAVRDTAASRAGLAAASDPALRALAWKREGLPDRQKYEEDYAYPSDDLRLRLALAQTPFTREGFASTVWDSGIVMAKMVERWHGEDAATFTGRRCLELGAGCGLVSTVLGRLGGRVVATDLEVNLPLLSVNVGDAAEVRALDWRRPETFGSEKWDWIFACDVWYEPSLMGDLVRCLEHLASPGATILISCGRNRWGLDAFERELKQSRTFSMAAVAAAELDPVYNSPDVDVYCLRRRNMGLRRKRKKSE